MKHKQVFLTILVLFAILSVGMVLQVAIAYLLPENLKAEIEE